MGKKINKIITTDSDIQTELHTVDYAIITYTDMGVNIEANCSSYKTPASYDNGKKPVKTIRIFKQISNQTFNKILQDIVDPLLDIPTIENPLSGGIIV